MNEDVWVRRNARRIVFRAPRRGNTNSGREGGAARGADSPCVAAARVRRRRAGGLILLNRAYTTQAAPSPSSRGLGLHSFKVATRVRIPLGTPASVGLPNYSPISMVWRARAAPVASHLRELTPATGGPGSTFQGHRVPGTGAGYHVLCARYRVRCLFLYGGDTVLGAGRWAHRWGAFAI